MSTHYGVIYLATNKLNGKRYVGQTKNMASRKKKYRNRLNASNRSYFECALAKYGMDSFEWSIIDGGDSRKELNAKEHEWIGHYRSNQKGIGYNLTSGGGQCEFNESTRAKMSASKKTAYANGAKHPFSGKKMYPHVIEALHRGLRKVQEAKRLLREEEKRNNPPKDCRFTKGMIPWNKGKAWSEESKKKMSQSRMGKTRPNARTPMLCVELDKVFYGINETAKIFELSAGNLSSTLSGKQKTWGGYTWKYLTESPWKEQPLTTQEL